MGIDGLSILLVLLTTFLTPISILSTWTAVEERVKEFMIFFLMLEVGMVGVFLSSGFIPVLRFLGIHPGADVFPDRDLGWGQTGFMPRSNSSFTLWLDRS